MKLTIGMATYDDSEGVYNTVNSLLLYHKEVHERLAKIVIVDNHPGSAHSKVLKGRLGWWGDIVRYVEMKEPVGTAPPRNRIFPEATGELVLVVDCHVSIELGAIQKLLYYYDKNPDTLDLLSGPLVYDDLRTISTHFDPIWGQNEEGKPGEMWGRWGTDQRGLDSTAEPFEIWGCGLGLFSCRKEAWLEFSPHFRSFGGEEGYLHEKYRQAGRKCLCLPFLRWTHRFGRVGAIPYPVGRWDKVRNYILGHVELGLSLKPVVEHFVATKLVSPQKWNELAREANQMLGRTIPTGASTAKREPPKEGPGTELHLLLEQVGISPDVGCNCAARIAQMNVWGVEGCRAHKNEIVGWMKDGDPKWGWTKAIAIKAKAGALAVSSGLVFDIGVLDPLARLVDLAIDNAAKKRATTLASQGGTA